VGDVNNPETQEAMVEMLERSRKHTLDLICSREEATEGKQKGNGLNNTGDMVYVGWTHIKETDGNTTQDIITTVKLRLASLRYEEVHEGNNFVILSVYNDEADAIIDRFKPSPQYEICWIPKPTQIWNTKANVSENQRSKVGAALKKQAKELGIVGYNLIPSKTQGALLVVAHVRKNAWTNATRSIIIEIDGKAVQLNPDVTNIPVPHIQLYTVNKNTSYSRKEWVEWIVKNLGFPRQTAQENTALTNAYNSTSNFTSAIVTTSIDSIKDKIDTRNLWTSIGTIPMINAHQIKGEVATQYAMRNPRMDGHILSSNIQNPLRRNTETYSRDWLEQKQRSNTLLTKIQLLEDTIDIILEEEVDPKEDPNEEEEGDMDTAD
jgi:hypothetical protein